jgi:uncharacterized delta-60 repeat protein
MRIPIGTAVLGFIAVTAVIGDTTGLDPAFGVGGKVVTDVSGRYDEIRALAIQGDGRIVVAGVTGTTPRRDFAIARYHSDGRLDPSFADAGTTVTDFGGGDDVAWAVAVQADGRIVVGGTTDGDFALARYSVDGTLDSQFGVGGKVAISLDGNARVNALTIQADGRIVGVGVAGSADFALVRLQANGTLDATFGTGGRVLTDFSGGPDTAFAVTLRADGRIVVAGSTGAYPTAQFAVAQYKADGALDPAFGSSGKALVSLPRDARAHALALQADGRVRVGGLINRGSSTGGIVVQLTVDGAVDTSFGDRGRVEADFGGRNFGTALALQSDGRFVVGGSDDFPPYYDFAIARYDPAGSLDASFNQGTILTEFGGNSWINAVAVQQDGDVVAAGYARGPGGADFALVRYSNRR